MHRTLLICRTVSILLAMLATGRMLRAGGDPEEGYRLLTEKAYLPADFDQETFDQLWQVWPTALREEAAVSTREDRRAMAYRRYGLTPRPGDSLERPLQYVVAANGDWSMNCFTCHGGKVHGKVVPGAPNRDLALETLTADVRQTKLRMGKPLSHMDLGSVFMPLGTTRGTTNAVMFGVALLAYRDNDLNLLPKRFPPRMVHHDMDAPPWWHFRKKKHLYIDGFAPKAHRPLMQFMLVEQNGPEQFQEWERDFEHVYAYLSSLDPPAYPSAIDHRLAEDGAIVFEQHCMECHGSYGDTPHEYPERRIAWKEIRTDPVRLRALTVEHRERYAKSWFADGHRGSVESAPSGYVAPPLDGIWASAPYLHNGSVPTLWHLLRPGERPTVWRRCSDADNDLQRVGLAIETFEHTPQDLGSREDRRDFFDTRRNGKSAAGHDFPDQLSEDQRIAVLEYLKTL